MEKSDRVSKLALVDKEFLSPELRASKVWTFLVANAKAGDLSDWDLLCFATSWIGSMALQFPWLMDDARKLNRLVYTAHYWDRETDEFKHGRNITKPSWGDGGGKSDSNDNLPNGESNRDQLRDDSSPNTL